MRNVGTLLIAFGLLTAADWASRRSTFEVVLLIAAALVIVVPVGVWRSNRELLKAESAMVATLAVVGLSVCFVLVAGAAEAVLHFGLSWGK